MWDQHLKKNISKINVEKSDNESPTSLGQNFRDDVTTLNLENWKMDCL